MNAAEKAKMLEAHVEFEVQRWQGEALRETLQAEVTALYTWLESVKLNEIVQPAQVVGVVQRTAIAMPVSVETYDSIRESVQVVFELLREDNTPLEEIVPRPLYDRAVTGIAGMEGARREITRQVVTSSVYTRLISNVLYNGIKNFLLTENALAKKIPGASSLMKLGQNALTSAAPTMEKNIDKQLVAFIHDNIQETIHESERFLDSALDEQALREVADEIWASNARSTVASIAGYTDAASVDAVAELVRDFWLHFRTTPLFLEVVEQLVRTFFLRHGKKPVRVLLDEVGVTPQQVVEELYAFAAPIAAKAAESGDLAQVIRRRLAVFYASYAG
jgi:hypothetical protein